MSLSGSRDSGIERPPRVPIPRLERIQGDKAQRTASRRKHIPRVSRACVRCNARKVRCDGGIPRCRNCLGNREPCVYVESRRNRLKTATEHNQDMVDLLKDLSAFVPERERQRIDEVLGRVNPNIFVTAAIPGLRKSSDSEEAPGEDNVSAEVGPNDETDMIDEDLFGDRDASAIGFLGKSSEVQWLRRVRRETEHNGNTSFGSDGPHGPPGKSPEAVFRMEAFNRRRQQQPRSREPAHTSTFYLDLETIEVDYSLDPTELPTMEIAQTLVDSYMATVQDTFPILSKPQFLCQVNQYYASTFQGTPSAMPRPWLAILNLVFAIGAKHMQLVQAYELVDGEGHLVYQSRAQILGLSGPALVSHPDSMQIQMTALLAFYFLSVGRANRAWVVLGTALRYAHALGLHVRNEDPTASMEKKENLVHIWWALYCLEVKLSAIVGRPSFTSEDFCSVPLPLPLTQEQLADEKSASRLYEQHRVASMQRNNIEASSATFEPANAGSFFKAIVRISTITQKAMVALYSARVPTHSWKHTQDTIASLRDQLASWSSSLPLGFHFTAPNVDNDLARGRFILRMYYTETKILICRPCLCRLDSSIATQTKTSDSVNKTIARDCVNAAKEMARILPDEVHLPFIYQYGLWWSLVHFLMRALTVLLLEMSYDTVHFPEDGEEIMLSIKKLIRWLRALKENDPLAQRAYTMAYELVRRVALQDRVDISDLLKEEATSRAAVRLSTSEDSFRTSGYTPSCPFWMTEDVQQSDREELNLRRGHGLHPAMFAFPSESVGAHHWHPPFADAAGPYPINLPFSKLSFGNTFTTAYDEQNLVPSSDSV